MSDYNYEKNNCTRVFIKLCNKTDADIIECLNNQKNKQGYIKELIREDIVIQKKIKHLKQCKGGYTGIISQESEGT